MKKILLFTVLMLLQKATIYAQVIEGTVKDATTKANLPYVNVGIIGKGIGTVTDAEGAYKIVLNNNDADSLKVSMIGYRSQNFSVADLKKHFGPLNIALEAGVIPLKEVKIYNHDFKQVVLGNTTQSKSTDAGFTSNELGNEIGAVIKIKKAPTFLKQFNASLAHSASDSVKLRLNFYSVKDGLPDKIIQQQNIFVTVKKGQDKISVDLTPYHIVVEDKFFVSLEWIQNSPGHGLMFSASLLSSAIISRETSQAKWEKVGLAGVGFNVSAEY